MRSPAVLFYTSDFLVGTMMMTDVQVGRYIRLLCYQHQHGHISASQFKKMTHGDADVKSKFVEDEDGCLYNERMEEEILKRNAHSEKQRANIMKRWESQAEPEVLWKAEMEQPKEDIGNTMVLPLENENENINNNTNTYGVIKKGRSPKSTFQKPSVDEVRAYCNERDSKVDPDSFVDFYESKGWKVGNQPMKDWKAAVRNWERSPINRSLPKASADFKQRKYDREKYDREGVIVIGEDDDFHERYKNINVVDFGDPK